MLAKNPQRGVSYDPAEARLSRERALALLSKLPPRDRARLLQDRRTRLIVGVGA